MSSLGTADKSYNTLITEVMNGEIKIPQFQRQFVWDIKKSANLIDSILKGYPIGTFIYWRTQDRLRTIRNIGNIDLPAATEGEFVNYVLDGQQRITSLFAALKGEKIIRENGKEEDFSEIYINLNASDDDESVILLDVSDVIDNTYIKVTELLHNNSRSFWNSFPEEYDQKIDMYKNKLMEYQFRGVNIKDAKIDQATDIFTRLNVGGKELSLFEIMIAKTFDKERDFDLYEEYQKIREELMSIHYDTIAPSTMLQLVALIIQRECTRKSILKLERDDFIANWSIAMDCLRSAVDFLRNFGIPVSRLLPYNTLVVPFAYYFYKQPHNPSGESLKLIEDFFWRCSLGNRYSSGVESKLVQDIDRIDKIIEGVNPRYDWSIDIEPDTLINEGNFSVSRSFIKSILCLYAMKKPKSFDNNLDVNIDNSWLKVATSKNYHHFFPKAYMKHNHPNFENWEVNSVLNITIVDDYLNKNKIRAKAPSDYIAVFENENANIQETLKTHFIDDLDDFGIYDNNFRDFLNMRAKKVSQELKKRIIIEENQNKDPLVKYKEVSFLNDDI